MAPGGLLRRRVVVSRLDPIVALIPVDRLSGPAEVYAAVVDVGRGHVKMVFACLGYNLLQMATLIAP